QGSGGHERLVSAPPFLASGLLYYGRRSCASEIKGGMDGHGEWSSVDMPYPPELAIPELISLHGLIVMIGLAVYVAVSHSLHQHRHPSAAIAWVITLALLPYVGLPLYLVFGTRKRARREYGPPRATGAGTEAAWPQRIAAAMDRAPA